jgi:hypothetical protein
MIEAPKVDSEGSAISQIEFKPQGWLDATVPGTVLSTYIDRGVYPDPDFGLNNLTIPETLSRRDYWYRTEFNPPASRRRHGDRPDRLERAEPDYPGAQITLKIAPGKSGAE